MPEGPEVKRIVVQLNSLLKEKEISKIEIISGRYKTHGNPDGFDETIALLPLRISEINCKGKFIWFTLTESNKEIYMWNTLGMTGSWSVKEDTHSRASFVFKDGTKAYYNDIRNFGTLSFCFERHLLDKKLDQIGPDMLSNPPTDSEFAAIVGKQKDKTLPEFLMNQSAISGVGNYVKAEALYLSELSPLRTCSSLSEKEILLLKKSIDMVLSASYNSGGSTIKTYRDVFGEAGSFSSRFLIYGNSKDPAGNKVIKTETKDGRTTHWVPNVQK